MEVLGGGELGSSSVYQQEGKGGENKHMGM